MGGAANGIAYHGAFIPYAGTFLTFSDYMRGSVRLAALSGLHVVYVWTHDSVGLGEDGPTHQPVEHYAALRAIPNLWFIRPGDANEAAAAWAVALERGAESPSGPVGLSLTRQKLPTLPGTAEHAREGVGRGGYVLREASGGAGSIGLIFIGTGSELQLAFGAAEALEKEGVPSRVVSMPCWELFERQDAAYRESVLPAGGPQTRRGGGRGLARLGALGRRRRARSWGSIISARRRRPGRSSRSSASPLIASPASPATLPPARSTARSRPWNPATCRPRAAATRRSHGGDPGVDRSSGTDPGHS